MTLENAIALRYARARARAKAIADMTLWTDEDLLDVLSLTPTTTVAEFSATRLGLPDVPDAPDEPSADLFVAQSRILAEQNPDIREGTA